MPITIDWTKVDPVLKKAMDVGQLAAFKATVQGVADTEMGAQHWAAGERSTVEEPASKAMVTGDVVAAGGGLGWNVVSVIKAQ